MALLHYVMVACLVGYAASDNITSLADDTCEPWDSGPWATLLEDWATTPAVHSDRHGRIMALPAANGYYVTERIDGPLVPPPPPMHHSAPHGPAAGAAHYPQGAPHHPQGAPHHAQGAPHHGAPVPLSYNEWETSPPPGGKIVNRPPNPYKDKFKPSYAPPTPGASPPRPQRPAADRVDAPPGKQVSETDLYLLGAIEKLVYRVDLMEKRLRRMEESVHHLVAGADTKPEPCPGNFTRVGSSCYHWSREAADWKGASVACRKMRASLVELLDAGQRRVFLAKLLADKHLRGNDFWTGGLNPGLLWIWSHSARPLESGNATSTIAGEGRCLALRHDPAAASYGYRGLDCAITLHYICQKDEDRELLANQIEKAARSLRLDKRKSKLLWEDV